MQAIPHSPTYVLGVYHQFLRGGHELPGHEQLVGVLAGRQPGQGHVLAALGARAFYWYYQHGFASEQVSKAQFGRLVSLAQLAGDGDFGLGGVGVGLPERRAAFGQCAAAAAGRRAGTATGRAMRGW